MLYPDVGLSRGTDYFLLHPELSAEEREYWDRARSFVDDEVLPVIADYWDRAEFPFPLVDKMAKLDIPAVAAKATSAMINTYSIKPWPASSLCRRTSVFRIRFVISLFSCVFLGKFPAPGLRWVKRTP